MVTQPCGECGAQNRPDAKTCRLCGGLLRAELAERPRYQRKILRRTDFFAAARANVRRTYWLAAGLIVIAGILGYLIGWNLELYGDPFPGSAVPWYGSRWGLVGAGLLLVASAAWSVVALNYGDRIVLSVSRAHKVGRDEEQRLHNVVEELSVAAGMTPPAVYVMETGALNAFATGLGPRRAAITVTRGLLERMNREELQGVVGHELGHIVNLDMRYATVVGVTVGLIAMVCDLVLRGFWYGGTYRRRSRRGYGGGPAALLLLIFAVLAPLFAYLVQMAVSRQREFLADATSVRLTRNPLGLISALEKLGGEAEPFDGANRATQHLFIVNPFRNFPEKASALLATHPPLEARIRRLRNLGDD